MPGLNEYMIARTAYFDHLFVEALNEQVPQIVLLGAGYDTRAYRFTEMNRGTKIFELDIEPTQNRKKQCLKKARIDIPATVTFVPIDFNQESLRDVLGNVGYDNHEHTLFLWEGVSYYLDAGSVDATLEYFSNYSQDDSAIAFDYTASISEDTVEEIYGVKEFAQIMKEHHADEELMFSIDEDELESFFEQRGLKIVDHMDNVAIERKFLQRENGSLLGRMTGHFRFVLALPVKNQNQ